MSRRLLVVSAGLGQPSSTRLLADRLAAATSDALLERGFETQVEVVDLRRHARALADHLVTGFATGALREVLDSVASADALVAVSPVFQGSYSGLFKSFFDVVDKDALRGTPVVVAATGGTARHSLVLEHAMRPLFAHLKAVVAPTAVYAASEDWGSVRSDEALAGRIERAGAELAGLAAARPRVASVDPFADLVPFGELRPTEG